MLPDSFNLLVECITLVCVVSLLVCPITVAVFCWLLLPGRLVGQLGAAGPPEAEPALAGTECGSSGHGAGGITPDAAYSAFVDAFHHSEGARWNRFGHFLIANSLLLAAWATLVSKSLPDNSCSAALKTVIEGARWCLPLAGCILSVLFLLHFVIRDQVYLELWKEKGKGFEQDNCRDPRYFFHALCRRHNDFKGTAKTLSSAALLPGVLALFAAGHLVLALYSVPQPWLLLLISILVLIIFFGVPWLVSTLFVREASN